VPAEVASSRVALTTSEGHVTSGVKVLYLVRLQHYKFGENGSNFSQGIKLVQNDAPINNFLSNLSILNTTYATGLIFQFSYSKTTIKISRQVTTIWLFTEDSMNGIKIKAKLENFR
jgi:hypothetical protein